MNMMNPDISLSNETVPVSEPERQYYYIEKAKTYVEALRERRGRPVTFCVTTFGCQMNARDSEKLQKKRKRISLFITPVPSVKTRIPECTDDWDS